MAKYQPDLSLMDELLQWTFSTRFDGKPIKPGGLKVMARFRAALRRAERFVLDDDVVRLISKLSIEKDKLDGWSFLARLPNEPLWVELDMNVLMEALDVHVDNAKCFPGARMGYLFMRDGEEGSPRWVCHEFQRMMSDDIPPLVPCACAYVFDPEGDPKWPVRGSKLWASATLSLRPYAPKIELTLVNNEDNSEVKKIQIDPEPYLSGLVINRLIKLDNEFVRENDADFVAAASMEALNGWFLNRSALIPEPFYERQHGGELCVKAIFKSMEKQGGALRGGLPWLISLLGAFNALPIEVKTGQHRVGRRMVGPRTEGYFQHHTVNITMPRDRVVYFTKKMDQIAHNARRPWHTVHGHWRVVERGRVKGPCRHYPVMVESGLGMCERCELLVRWIEVPHGRGDPTVGIVQKDAYRLMMKKGAS